MSRPIWIALWFDKEDRMFRVAGVYRSEAEAWKRVEKLGCGTVQHVTIGIPILFCHERQQP